MDLNLINKTIVELERQPTNYCNCTKLANLYIVRDHCEASKDNYTDDLVNCYRNFVCCNDENKDMYLSCFLDELSKTMKNLEKIGTKEEKDMINHFYNRVGNTSPNLEINK